MIDTQRHFRKLKRGAHRGNRFHVALRADMSDVDQEVLESRLALIRDNGVPNYFGEQRFGRDGANVVLGQAALAGKRLSRDKRNIGISALRSFEFNTALDARVRNGTWQRLSPGDIANLDGSGSVFDVDDVTQELEDRCTNLDVHPAGILTGYEKLKVAASFRPLRMRIQDLAWEIAADALWLDFTLGRGQYATAVLREVAGW